ncbi:MAG: response regulator, partial [Bacteroidota bacterium]
LGLSIVKQLVEGQGGRIWVESKEDEGSSFKIQLSLQVESTFGERSKSFREGESDLATLQGRRLLLVEDNASNQLLVSRMLSSHEVEVDTADNGQEALRLIEPGRYDLILSDLNMPDMGGEELISWIRAQDESQIRELPVIVLTGETDINIRDRLNTMSVEGFLTKPIQPEVLLETLADLLGSREAASPNARPVQNEPLDLGSLYRVSRQNTKFVRDMIQIFLDLTPRALQQMWDALDECNWVNLRRTAHFIKSTFNTIGNQELFHLTLEVEKIATSDPQAIDLRKRLERIDAICQNLIPRLQKFLNTEMSLAAASKV